MDFGAIDEALSLCYSLLEHTTASFSRTNENGDGAVGGTSSGDALPHQNSIREMEIEPGVNLHHPCNNADEEFYQPPETDEIKRLADQEMKIVPIQCNDSSDDFIHPVAAIVKVEPFNGEALQSSSIKPLSEAQTSQEENMLLDPILSAMDVSSLIQLNETMENVNDQELSSAKPRTVGRSRKRKLNGMDEAVDQAGDTLMSEVRRSNRRRNSTEIFKIERSFPKSSKKKRFGKLPDRQSSVQHQVKIEIADENPTEKVVTPPFQEQDVKTEQKTNELKIILRRYPPVNPLRKHYLGARRYRQGLINARKHASAELYLTHGIKPKSWLPWLQRKKDEENKKKKQQINDERVKSDGIKAVKDLMRFECMTNANLIGNYRAHGQRVLDEAEETVTPDGNAIKGSIAFINLDDIYDDLLDIQESIVQRPQPEILQDIGGTKSDTEAVELNPLTTTTTISEPSSPTPELHNVFANEFQFSNDYFEENCNNKQSETFGFDYDEITGASPIDTKTLEADPNFIDKHTVFCYNGRFYKVNPMAVLVVRTPDQLIEDIMSEPKKVTLESPFYSTLTTYFDNKEQSKINPQM